MSHGRPAECLPLPPGLPPARVWVPASTYPEALAALDVLSRAISEGPPPPSQHKPDSC